MNASPVPQSERLEVLDILRGFALLGILVMNLPYFSGSFFAGHDGNERWPAWWDLGTEFFRTTFFDGKFNSIFSFLFALGFTLQYDRLLAQDVQRASQVYVRRLLLLLLFGLLHFALIWPGDVLHVYALMGFALLWARRLPTRVYWWLLAACLAFPAVRSVVRFLIATPEQMQLLQSHMAAEYALTDAAYRNGSWLDTVRTNLHMFSDFYFNPLTYWQPISWFIMLLATMLLGLLAARYHLFTSDMLGSPVLKRLQWWSLAIGVLCGVIASQWDRYVKPGEISVLNILFSCCYSISRVSVMCFYVFIIARLAAHLRWRRRLQMFADVGRLPLSNYLFQSVFCTTLFYGWGFGLWDSIGTLGLFLLAFVIFFAVQVPLSRLILRRYHHGPMEWLWRRYTYGPSQLAMSSKA